MGALPRRSRTRGGRRRSPRCTTDTGRVATAENHQQSSPEPPWALSRGPRRRRGGWGWGNGAGTFACGRSEGLELDRAACRVRPPTDAVLAHPRYPLRLPFLRHSSALTQPVPVCQVAQTNAPGDLQPRRFPGAPRRHATRGYCAMCAVAHARAIARERRQSSCSWHMTSPGAHGRRFLRFRSCIWTSDDGHP